MNFFEQQERDLEMLDQLTLDLEPRNISTVRLDYPGEVNMIATSAGFLPSTLPCLLQKEFAKPHKEYPYDGWNGELNDVADSQDLAALFQSEEADLQEFPAIQSWQAELLEFGRCHPNFGWVEVEGPPILTPPGSSASDDTTSVRLTTQSLHPEPKSVYRKCSRLKSLRIRTDLSDRYSYLNLGGKYSQTNLMAEPDQDALQLAALHPVQPQAQPIARQGVNFGQANANQQGRIQTAAQRLRRVHRATDLIEARVRHLSLRNRIVNELADAQDQDRTGYGVVYPTVATIQALNEPKKLEFFNNLVNQGWHDTNAQGVQFLHIPATKEFDPALFLNVEPNVVNPQEPDPRVREAGIIEEKKPLEILVTSTDTKGKVRVEKVNKPCKLLLALFPVGTVQAPLINGQPSKRVLFLHLKVTLRCWNPVTSDSRVESEFVWVDNEVFFNADIDDVKAFYALTFFRAQPGNLQEDILTRWVWSPLVIRLLDENLNYYPSKVFLNREGTSKLLCYLSRAALWDDDIEFLEVEGRKGPVRELWMRPRVHQNDGDCRTILRNAGMNAVEIATVMEHVIPNQPVNSGITKALGEKILKEVKDKHHARHSKVHRRSHDTVTEQANIMTVIHNEDVTDTFVVEEAMSRIENYPLFHCMKGRRGYLKNLSGSKLRIIAESRMHDTVNGVRVAANDHQVVAAEADRRYSSYLRCIHDLTVEMSKRFHGKNNLVHALGDERFLRTGEVLVVASTDGNKFAITRKKHDTTVSQLPAAAGGRAPTPGLYTRAPKHLLKNSETMNPCDRLAYLEEHGMKKREMGEIDAAQLRIGANAQEHLREYFADKRNAKAKRKTGRRGGSKSKSKSKQRDQQQKRKQSRRRGKSERGRSQSKQRRGSQGRRQGDRQERRGSGRRNGTSNQRDRNRSNDQRRSEGRGQRGGDNRRGRSSRRSRQHHRG